MGTEIKVWEIQNDRIVSVEESSLAAEHLEAELECWIAERPEILGEDLLIVSKQKSIDQVGRLDLLAIDRLGQIVIVELKRDLTPREAVAQSLDYASWLNNATENEVLQIAEDYLKKPVAEAFAEHFGSKIPTITPQNHRIVLVGSKLDASSERIINYLAQRHGVNINAVFFRYSKLSNGSEVLVRSVLVAESVIQTGAAGKQGATLTSLLEMAATRKILPTVQILRKLAEDEDYVWEESATTYGGSFRFWRRNVEGRAKMVLGLNVSGDRRDTPIGQLDVWFAPATLAQVLDVSESEMKSMVRELPIYEATANECIVRLTDTKAAEELMDRLKSWFDKYPGINVPSKP